MRYLAALWIAKAARLFMRLLKYNATNYPGELALKICPDFLGHIGKPKTIIAVTGTNGKTTVSNLLCDTLERDGKKILNNRLGSNIASGISTSLIAGSDLFGKCRYDTAVLEIDERSAPRVYPYIKPDYIIITNLFRDSIMRNAHPEYIAGLLSRYIPATSKLISNADDLISCRVAPQCSRVYFGLSRRPEDRTDCINLINDMRTCPECGERLRYEYLRYHHIGKAYCEKCGFRSPEYDYAGFDADLDKMTVRVRGHGGEGVYHLPSDSVFNTYNVTAVVALLCEMGYTHERLTRLMSDIQIVTSRYSSEEKNGVRVIMQLAKDRNALACSRAFDYVTGLPGNKKIVTMMNNLGDEKHWSENTCWMYDCDFEFLTREGVELVVTSGPRAFDYRLRLLIAGVPEEKIVCVPNEADVSDNLDVRPGDRIFILHGTDSLGRANAIRKKIFEIAEEAAK